GGQFRGRGGGGWPVRLVVRQVGGGGRPRAAVPSASDDARATIAGPVSWLLRPAKPRADGRGRTSAPLPAGRAVIRPAGARSGSPAPGRGRRGAGPRGPAGRAAGTSGTRAARRRPSGRRTTGRAPRTRRARTTAAS